MTRPVRVALAQLHARPYDADGNRRLVAEALRRGFGDGADLVVLPELVASGYALDGERLRALAEPLDGPTVAAWTRAAADAGGFVAGGFCERSADDVFNTAVIVGPDGVVAHYRKLHLFDRERDVFAPGDLGLPVADTPLGRLGICVCYDLRFVEVVRVLALRGVEIICVPTAWIGGFDPGSKAALCPQAQGALLQANLSQVYLACASHAGSSGEFRFLGNSLIADPYGHPVREPLSADAEAIVCDVVDLAQVEKAQQRGERIRPRQDRRADVYAIRYGDAHY